MARSEQTLNAAVMSASRNAPIDHQHCLQSLGRDLVETGFISRLESKPMAVSAVASQSEYRKYKMDVVNLAVRQGRRNGILPGMLSPVWIFVLKKLVIPYLLELLFGADDAVDN